MGLRLPQARRLVRPPAGAAAQNPANSHPLHSCGPSAREVRALQTDPEFIQLNARFIELVSRVDRTDLTWDQVRAVRAKGQQHLLSIIAVILGARLGEVLFNPAAACAS